MTWLCLDCLGEVTLVVDPVLASVAMVLWSDLGMVRCPHCGGVDGAKRK